MINIRHSAERGGFDYGWLKTQHTFSFNGYYDPNHMGFRTLRVINQDIVEPGKGFDPHFHRDMEIITYILRGSITHQDSLGNTSVIKAGEIQRMSAGTGVRHSEYNSSPNEVLELLQIWILPDKIDINPSYEQISFPKTMPQFRLLVSPDGHQGSLSIHQDVKIFTVALTAGKKFSYDLMPQRFAWLQLINGEISLDDQIVAPGDGVAIGEQDVINLTANQPSEFLLFDLN